MTKSNVDFDTWIELLQMNLADKGILSEEETLKSDYRIDYDKGRDMFDVLDEVIAEYED